MSFGQELKDFAAGFGTGVGIRERVSRSKYYDALAKKAEGDSFDVDAAVKEDPAYHGEDKPHGLLYNMGHWLGLNDDDKEKRATGASTANPLGATQEMGAVPLDSYEAAMHPETDGYVSGYSAGGLVTDEEDPDQAAAVAPSVQAAPVERAIPDEAAPAQAAPPRPADDAGLPDEQVVSRPTKEVLAEALRGGMSALQTEFGLKQQGVPDEQTMAAGRQRLMAGDGRASQADMAAVAKAVDPNGELSHSQMMLRAMTKGYEFYLKRGMPDKANNYAASIIQYATYQASKFGEDAVALIQKGDMKGAAKAVAAGYSHLPDGKEATDVQVSPDGKSVTVTETDVETGKPINKHTLTGMQLYQGAIGLANRSESWKALMSAAAAAKGVNLPPSDAYNSAIDRLNGVNPDGTVTQPGNAPPAGYQPQSAVQETPVAPQAPASPPGQQPASGNLIARADPNAMFLVESGNNPNAVSPKGARGVGQTMEGTLRDPGYGVQPARDNSPQELQRVATDYLAAMNAHYKDPVLAHIAYNMGPGNTDAWLKAGGQFSKLPQETQQYLGRIAVAQSQGGRAAPAAPSPSAPPAPAAAAPRPDFQRGQSLQLRPALEEDTPEQPDIPTVGERPVAPEQLRVTSKDTEGMSGPERVAYTRAVAEQNKQRQTKFREEMQLYNSSVSARDKAQKAAAAKGKGGEPFKLPVKDRTDALAALKEARPDPADTTDITAVKFAELQPNSQKAIDDIAYGLYTHNDTTPQRSYQAAVSMMNPKQQSFTPYEMPGTDKVRIVFRSGDKMVMPKNTFDQLAALRGNEHYIARTAADAADKTAAEDAKLALDRSGAIQSGINIGSQIADTGKAALRAVDKGIGQVLTDPVKAGRKAVTKVGRGVLNTLDKGLVHQR